ncbi:creatininase family protein, partial [Alkalibacillus haloalkaliphilus]|uniref:creatininase family protein n=1 Tax=Alkalibacillus haloalkaliphilus TaxID=94136 RepID=UPI0003794337
DHIDDIRESSDGGMGHAGEFETSLMLYLSSFNISKDDYIDEPVSVDKGLSSDLYAANTFDRYRFFDDFTDSGVVGTPSFASKEKGEIIMKMLNQEYEKIVVNHFGGESHSTFS